MTKLKEKKNTKETKKDVAGMIYDSLGKEKGEIKLPSGIFGLAWNADLVHQVAVSFMSNRRNNVAHTKDRSDVAGGGKKPWRQKGTGRARHGSIRSPIWRGGGVTFGPRSEKNFEKKVNRKMKVKALFTVLSKKTKQGETFLVENIKVKEAKTKEAKGLLSGLTTIKGLENILLKKNNSAVFVFPEISTEIKRSFKNFGNIELVEARNLNILDLLNFKNVILVSPKETIEVLESKMK